MGQGTLHFEQLWKLLVPERSENKGDRYAENFSGMDRVHGKGEKYSAFVPGGDVVSEYLLAICQYRWQYCGCYALCYFGQQNYAPTARHCQC